MFNFDVLFVFWRRAKKPHSEGGLNKKWGGWPTFGNVIIWSPKIPLYYSVTRNTPATKTAGRIISSAQCSVGQWKECHPRNYNTTARWWNPLASSFCHSSKSLPKRQTISAQFWEHLLACLHCLDISKDMYCITGHLCGSKSSAKQETTCEHAPV